MNFTPEQLTKARTAKSVEELLTLAKENGLELTEEEAKKYFADLHKEGELADDELENVSGGCSSATGYRRFDFQCPFCYQTIKVTITYYSYGNYSYGYSTQDIYNCDCGAGIQVYDSTKNAYFTKDGDNKLVKSTSSGDLYPA